MNKINFEVKQEDGSVLKLAVVKPSQKVRRQSDLVYAKAFKENLEAGAMLKSKAEAILIEQKIWDENKQKRFVELQNDITKNEKIVEGKVKGTTLAKAREAAIQLRKDRVALRNLVAEKSTMESKTAEGMAENERFSYLVSSCTVYSDSGKPFFASQEEYEKMENNVSFEAAQNFANLWYGLDQDFEKNLPENKFLSKHKLCDDKLRLVDKQGRLVDSKGKLINEDGRYITEDGKFCDSEGRLVDEEGNYLDEEVFPFLEE